CAPTRRSPRSRRKASRCWRRVADFVLEALTADEWTAIRLSLGVAVIATAGSLPFGIAGALRLARGRFPGRTLLDGRIRLPLARPPGVPGYLLRIRAGRRGPSGPCLCETFGIVSAVRWTGAALACAVMGCPLMVRALRLSAEAVDRRLESAAASLGASRLVV